MNVKELMKQLRKLDPEMRVLGYDAFCGNYSPDISVDEAFFADDPKSKNKFKRRVGDDPNTFKAVIIS